MSGSPGPTKVSPEIEASPPSPLSRQATVCKYVGSNKKLSQGRMPNKRPRGGPPLQSNLILGMDPNHIKHHMSLIYVFQECCKFQESLLSKRASNKCNKVRVALSEATRCTPTAHCKAHGNQPTTHKLIMYTMRISLLPAPRN